MNFIFFLHNFHIRHLLYLFIYAHLESPQVVLVFLQWILDVDLDEISPPQKTYTDCKHGCGMLMSRRKLKLVALDLLGAGYLDINGGVFILLLNNQ